MLNGKVMKIHLKVGLIKKILLYKMNYNPPCGHRKNEKKLNWICLIIQQNLT